MVCSGGRNRSEGPRLPRGGSVGRDFLEPRGRRGGFWPGQQGSTKARGRAQHGVRGGDSCHPPGERGGQPSRNIEHRGDCGLNTPRDGAERREGARCCVWPLVGGAVLQPGAGGLHLRKDTWSQVSTENSRSFWPIVSEAFGWNIWHGQLF